jgi:BASS family bile acid:Na+ symporter
MGLVFVLGTIISMGLSLTMKQITGPLRNVRFVIITLLANFVIVPIAAYIFIQVFALDESLAIGLLLVSLAAGAPGLPKMAEFAKQDTATATSMMVLLVVVTIIILPIALPLLLAEVSVTFWDIASGLVYLMLIPLAISLFVRARYPEAAASAQPYFTQASNISLLFLMVLMVVLNFNNVVGLFGSGGLLASLILVIVSAAGAYLLGSLGGTHK